MNFITIRREFFFFFFIEYGYYGIYERRVGKLWKRVHLQEEFKKRGSEIF